MLCQNFYPKMSKFLPKIMSALLKLIFCVLIFLNGVACQYGISSLEMKLFRGTPKYNPNVRPAKNAGDRTNVSLSIDLDHIEAVVRHLLLLLRFFGKVHRW